ncbi:MAG: hypothetical protein HGJ93_00655 [Desulfosarcina sp.]|nr:hypothetical protein [Desulfosarcina sp.]MBC2764496.1 hypothetical protein [Desulfosarcina sp.]
MKTDPKSSAHKKILELVKDCYDLSAKHMRQRYAKWNKSEKMDRSFIDVTETDSKGRKKQPHETKIYIPMSRACKDTILTYWMSVFTRRRPIFKIHGRGPEDVKPAAINEIVMDYQAERQRLMLVIYNFCNDILRYGLGSIKAPYGREWQKAFVNESQMVMFPFPHQVSNRVEKDVIKYEGPLFCNNNPYRYFPDPRVPISKARTGQFIGYEYQRSKYYLKKQAANGVYQNIDRLDAIAQTTDDMNHDADDSHKNDLMGVSDVAQTGGERLDSSNPNYRLREFVVEIIPKDLELGEGTMPEKWVFVTANEQIVIRAEKQIYVHGEFPEVRAEFDYDGHSLFTPSFYEGVEGLQDLLNWLYNSHMDNVRGFLNNSMIYDPAVLNTRDILKPGPRRLIRVNKQFQGKGINLNSVLKQLDYKDVTASHVRDAQMLMDTMQRQAHTPDSLQGIETEIKRTATEIAKVTSNGANHLSNGAALIYAQALVPLAEMCVMMNQQFLSEERFYRIVGDYSKELIQPDQQFTGGPAIKASPQDIQGCFDFPIEDGTLPVRPQENAEIWKSIFETVAKVPPIQQQIDIFKIFKELVQTLGVKNIDDFKVTANVMPDEQVTDQLQRGNIIPMPAQEGVE